METQNNHTLVPILGIMLDSVSVSRAVEISKTYLENDYFNLILLVGMKISVESERSIEIKELSISADLILPGDENIEKAANMEFQGRYQEQYLDQILMLMAKEHRRLCILCDMEEQSEEISKILESDYPGLKVSGSVFTETGAEEMEALVNKINGEFPDAILPLVSIEKQQALLKSHKEKLNAKLCIASETVYYSLMAADPNDRESSKLVKWLRDKFHFGKKAVENEFWQKLKDENEKENLDIWEE